MANATTVDELQVLITASSKEFAKQINDVKGQISNLAKSAEHTAPRISAPMIAAGNIIAKALTAAFRAIANSMSEAVSRLDTLNNFPKVMSNLGIGAEESQKAIDYLAEKLQGLPTTIDSAALAVQRFTSANGNIGASTQMFLALNNAILAGGASMEIQSSALEQISQAYAKNKPDMMEWRTMMMAMPAQLKQIANAMGYATSNDLGEALRSGAVSMNEFMTTIAKLNREGYAGFANFEEQARNATGGVQTSIINMKTALVRGLQQIMDAIGQSNIAGFFNVVAGAIGTAANYVAAFIRLVLTAINALRALFGQSAISFGKTSSSASGAASAVSGIGSAADDATDAIGGTGAAAKKLQKQLAGFDEMNVLKEPEPSSGGGGGGGGSTGAGGADLSGLEFDTADFEKGTDKITDLAKKMKESLQKIFNFDKIGKAIKKFADDVKKFIEPIGKIASQIWNNYLKPFVSWAGNDLFPAFLNALGGAISFVGSAIKTFWDNFLRPFVDNFLVPIAKWTGGIIISVLNGIGDALRSLGENQVFMDAFIASIVTLGAVIVSSMIATKVTAIGTAIAGAISQTLAFQTAAMAVSPVLGGLAIQTTGLTGAMASLGSGLTSMLGAVFNPVTIAILGVVAAITAVVTIVEFFKTKQMEAEAQTQTYITAEQMATQVANDRQRAVEDEKAALDSLSDAIAGVNSANLDLVSAEENLRSATENLNTAASDNNMTTEEAISWFNSLNGDLSKLDDKQLKLAKSVAQYTTAQDRQTESAKKLSDAQAEVSAQEDVLYDAQSRELRAMLDSQAQAIANTGDYAALADMLTELASNEYEFVDAQGNTVHRSKDEMAWLTKGVADDVAEAYEDWDRLWKEFPTSVNDVETDLTTNLNKISNKVRSSGTQSGNNFGTGVVSGIVANNGAVYQAGWNQAAQGVAGFNARLQIHSPSRIMKESGSFFGEGVVEGIESQFGEVRKVSQSLAKVAETSFSPELGSVELGKTISDKIAQSSLDLDLDSTPVHVTVKVGEETLVNKIIEGINEASFLNNTTVINV
jgi:tape measure domain-containing protein